ncbi:MAG: hypothetical protein H0W76_13775, partial [Pyrinomonadaceae bacterium]|nr:hypothetical protein [Pyrinomonadaceae bacterium]
MTLRQGIHRRELRRASAFLAMLLFTLASSFSIRAQKTGNENSSPGMSSVSTGAARTYSA